jgi:hypothetical protein
MEHIFKDTMRRDINESHNLKRINPEREMRSVKTFLDSKLLSDLRRVVDGIPPRWNK